MDILDLLASDVKIVDSTIRTGTELVFPGSLMPDGKDYIAQAPATLTPTLLREWCNAVRGEYDARQSRKETTAASNAPVHNAGVSAADRASVQSGSSGNGSEADGEAREASLEESLKSEVARWAKREREATEEAARFDDAFRAAVARRDECARYLLKAQKVLDFYLAQTQEVEEL